MLMQSREYIALREGHTCLHIRRRTHRNLLNIPDVFAPILIYLYGIYLFELVSGTGVTFTL